MQIRLKKDLTSKFNNIEINYRKQVKMETNRIEIKDKRTLTRLLRSCYYVYAYVVMSKVDTGRFI